MTSLLTAIPALDNFDDPDKLKKVLSSLDIVMHHVDSETDKTLIFLELNGIILGNGGFIISVIQPYAMKDDETGTTAEKLMVLMEVSKREFSNVCVNYIFQMAANVVVLCSYPRMVNIDAGESRMLIGEVVKALASVRNICAGAYGLDIISAVSPMGNGVRSIPQCFFYATEQLEYLRFMENRDTPYRDPSRIKTKRLRLQGAEVQRAASNFAGLIAQKKIGSVPNEVSKFIRSITDIEEQSIRNLHFSLLLFCETFLDELLKLNLVDNVYLQNHDFIGSLYEVDTVTELIDSLIKIINEIQAYVDKKEDQDNLAVLESVRNYIREHYRDPSLTVADIARSFNMNQTTLSNMFRLYYGTSLLVGIREIRVRQAKLLLRDSGNGLERVAELCGFGCVNTMYRAFHSVEGLAPGSYRQND